MLHTGIESGERAQPGSRRLDSWKEIAGYFGKDIRTVRRWEVERSLPVHRVRGGERGSVFAYVAELEAWLREKDTGEAIAEQTQPDRLAAAETRRMEAAAGASDAPSAVLAGAGAEGSPTERAQTKPSMGRGWVVGLVAVAALLLISTGWLRYAGARPASGGRVVLSAARVPDTAARDLYLRGRYLWNLRTEASLNQAVDLFTQAIVRDPNYASAYAGLSDSYLLLRQYGQMTDAQAYPRAYSASRRALALDDSSVEAHRSYAFVLDHWMWNFPAAEAEYRRTIALDPKDAQSHHWYATSLLSAGRFGDALREIEVARQLQPESVAILANRGLILKFTDESAALASLLELEQANPGFASVHTYLATIHLDRNEYNEFLREARQSAVLLGHSAEIAVIDRAKDELGRHGERSMMVALAEGYGRLADDPGDPHATVAALYFAHLKDSERTLQYLSLSCARRESNFQAVPYMPEYGFLKGNPRFEALLKRGRTPWDAPAEAAADASPGAAR